MDPAEERLVAEAKSRLADAVVHDVAFPEIAFGLRGGECVIVAGGSAPNRRLLGGAAVVAAAEVLLHVAAADAAVDHRTGGPALSVLRLPIVGEPSLVVHPLQVVGGTVIWGAPVAADDDSAVWGSLRTELTATWQMHTPAERIALLAELERSGLLLEVAPALDAELSRLIDGQ